MTYPTHYEGPFGIGEWDEDNWPGQGSGQPTTEMNGLDFRIAINWYKRIFARFRLIGFDNLMPNQDYKESVGGFQTLHTYDGGITAYAFSNGYEALQLLGISAIEDSANEATAMAAQTFRVGVRAPEEQPDNSTGLHDDANAFAFKNGTHQRMFIKGDGRMVQLLGKKNWDPILLCEAGPIALHPASKASLTWEMNNEITVRGFLYTAEAAPGNPGYLMIGNLPFNIAQGDENYGSFQPRMHNLVPQAPGIYQGHGKVGTNRLIIERFDFATGNAQDCAAAIKAGSQIIFEITVPAVFPQGE